jgi:hypothetical protein
MQDEFEDNTGVIKIRKAKMDRQHYGQQLKDKITNNDLQNTAQKTKDRATRTPLKIGCELMYSGCVNFSCSPKVALVVLFQIQYMQISISVEE